MSEDRNAASDTAKPLHIVEFCTKFGIGGITKYATELGAWLRSRGHRVSYAGTPGQWVNPETEANFLPLRTHDVTGEENHTLLGRLVNAVRSAAALRKWLLKNAVDVIHTHESTPALVAQIATLGMKIPVVVTYHGSEPDRIRQFGSIVRFSAKVIVTCRSTAHDLEQIGGVPRDKLTIIRLGVKPAPTCEDNKVASLRRELLGDDGTRLVVTVARICEQKGIDVLVECVRQLKKMHSNYRFVVVGDGPLKQEAHRWAREAEVTSHLSFVGWSKEPYLYLKAADLFLLTSRWEAMTYVILEAFQAGIPSVATDCKGVSELVDDSVGRIVPIGNVPAICKAVVDILENEPLRASMAEAALSRTRGDSFSPEKNFRGIEQVYLRLTQG